MVKPDLMQCRDISADMWKTKRITNPLEPVYNVKDKDGQLMDVGEIEGSKPRLGHSIKEPYYRALSTSDIEGAQPNTTNAYLKKVKQQLNSINT